MRHRRVSEEGYSLKRYLGVRVLGDRKEQFGGHRELPLWACQWVACLECGQ